MQRVVRPVLACVLGACSGKGSGRCETRLDLLPVELAELALLDVDEVEGVGDLKVTLLAGGGDICRARPLALALACLFFCFVA